MKDVQNKAKSVVERVFPERQIYHRSDGAVQYISISPAQQMMFAGGVALAAGWCLFATVSVISQGPRLSASSDALDRNEAKWQRWVSETNARAATAQSLLEERTQAFERETNEFKRRHETLKLLITALKSNEAIDTASLRGNGSSLLIEASIDEAAPRQSREAPVVTASLEVAGFRAKIDTLRQEQTAFLAEAEELAVERAERARGVLKLTGIGIGRFEEQRELGGPLLELAAVSAEGAIDQEDIHFAERVTQVAARLDEAHYFEDVVESLPLGKPVGVPYRETSGYGLRRDPFTRRPAFHAGMDFGAFRGAPITTTGPGTVTFAGNRSGYGRMVEVEHGYGFRTRYGHLSTIDVKKGDTVNLGDQVGRMGSTGRSTGPHLHYEVWFRGKTYNPREFLRAGQHVHEG